MKRTKPEMN